MKKLTAIPALCVLFGSLFTAIPANSQTITGTWETVFFDQVAANRSGTYPDPTNGAILFGNLPTPGMLVTETATSITFGWTGGPLPIPTYSSDGSPAAPPEILWTVQLEGFGHPHGGGILDQGSSVKIDYTGGTTASLSILGPPSLPFGFGCRVSASNAGVDFLFPANVCAAVTAVAIRTQAPVAVSEQTWGKTKSDYK